MAKINVNNIEYEYDSLSDNAKGQVVNLQFVEAELQRFTALTAVYKTARDAYVQALQAELPTTNSKSN